MRPITALETALVWFAAGVLAMLQGCSTSDPIGCQNDFDLLVGEIGCPSSFDGTAATLPPCRSSDGYNQTVWLCDVIYLHTGMGTTEGDCYYDPIAFTLVGVRRYATTSGFCEGKSLTESAGRQPRTCPSAAAIHQLCEPSSSDAGLVDDAASDG